LVYDLTRKDTLDKLPLWIEQLEKYSPDIPLKILVGNKNDLINDRAVPFEAGEVAKQEWNISNFFETSAKTGDHIQEAFEDLARTLVDNNRDKVLDTTEE